MHLCPSFFANNFFTFFLQCLTTLYFTPWFYNLIFQFNNLLMSFCLCFVEFALFILSILLSQWMSCMFTMAFVLWAIYFFLKLPSKELTNTKPTNVIVNLNIQAPKEITNTCVMVVVALHDCQLSSMLNNLSINLRHWVKLRSTTWFLRFFMIEYDDKHFENFNMTHGKFFQIGHQLITFITNKNTM